MTLADRAVSEDLYPSRVAAEPDLLPRRDPVLWGNADDGPLRADHLRRYDHFGYLIFEGMFHAAEVEHYATELAELCSDPAMRGRPEAFAEPGCDQLRWIHAVHELDHPLAQLCTDRRIVDIARQLLGGDVYIHQSRVDHQPAFRGQELYWHSDFETWHVEDGMPRMRAVSCSITLTENTPHNGPLLLVPASHHRFVACVGETPERNFESSLLEQEHALPDHDSLSRLVDEGGIEAAVGGAGSVTFFECNVMNGSNSNITPWARSNCLVVFNSVENTLGEPFCGLEPRPQYLANREQVRAL